MRRWRTCFPVFGLCERQRVSSQDGLLRQLRGHVFRAPENRYLIRAIAVDYLLKLRDEAQAIHDDVDRYVNLRKSIMEEVARLRAVTKDEAERARLLKQFLLRF